jgi:hypothetical protein
MRLRAVCPRTTAWLPKVGSAESIRLNRAAAATNHVRTETETRTVMNCHFVRVAESNSGTKCEGYRFWKERCLRMLVTLSLKKAEISIPLEMKSGNGALPPAAEWLLKSTH